MRICALLFKSAEKLATYPFIFAYCFCHVDRSGDISKYFGNSKRFLDYARNDRTINARCIMQGVTIRVPASTSNLGPGFDCLGVALRIYNSMTIGRAKDRQRQPKIVAQAADLFFKRAKRQKFPFSCSAREKIPRSRGLGSSATIRLGILHGLNELSGKPLDRLSIFQLCAELEGHPD